LRFFNRFLRQRLTNFEQKRLAGATSISAALDAIDQSHLLPAMARLEQHRDKATKIQGDVPLLQRCSSTSLDSMPREKDAKVAKMSSGDALRPHAGAAGFCDEKHTASRAFQSEVRGTKSANSSDSTWLSPVILEHRVVGNPEEHVDEGVHDSYLDHARKLGSLLVSAPSRILAPCFDVTVFYIFLEVGLEEELPDRILLT
jgi:hypothetical protein